MNYFSERRWRSFFGLIGPPMTGSIHYSQVLHLWLVIVTMFVCPVSAHHVAIPGSYIAFGTAWSPLHLTDMLDISSAASPSPTSETIIGGFFIISCLMLMYATSV